MKNFKQIHTANQVPNADMETLVREFTGKLTPRRNEILNEICKRMSFNTNCGHSYDCCGCLCSQTATFSYKHNQVSLYVTKYYNY